MLKNRSEGEHTLTLCCLQERRKQQRRLFDAQQIQREMSQLEWQYDELEEVGRDIEQALRDAEESKCVMLFLPALFLAQQLCTAVVKSIGSVCPGHIQLTLRAGCAV